MKKTINVLLLLCSSAVIGGCAVTDYGSFENPMNRSHGIIDCRSGDRIANTQQTLEPQTRDMFANLRDEATGQTVCAPDAEDGAPVLTTDNVSHREARDWNRFIGTYAVVNELRWPGEGTWFLGGVKLLPDGSRRINTYFRPEFGNFSCGSAGLDGLLGSPEGMLYSQGLSVGGEEPLLPGLEIDTVAIDRSPDNVSQFCRNIVAMSPTRAAEGFTFYIGQPGRVNEGRLAATPITRREGLADFYAGRQLTVQWQGLSITAHGAIADRGIDVFVDSVVAGGGVSYVPADGHEVRINVDPTDGLRTIELDVPREELPRLARFALDSGLADSTIELGQFIPELGLQLPEMQGQFVRPALERIAEGDGSIDDPVFGG